MTDQKPNPTAAPLSPESANALFDRFFGETLPNSVACGLSGGPDSMALCWLLSQWGTARRVYIHALTVDHGLRPNAAEEAAWTGAQVSVWPMVAHTTLKWRGKKPEKRIMETARQARYALMERYCRREKIPDLFIAHHLDDQGETFLMRLAGGSGLNGLAGMAPVQPFPSGVRLLRPLLDLPKKTLTDICAANEIPFVNDPSNTKTEYLRPRLRDAKDLLSREGLSNKRLSVTAARLRRAREALEDISRNVLTLVTLERTKEKIVLDHAALSAYPEEIRLRVLQDAAAALTPKKTYGPRMEKLEALAESLFADAPFRKRTLGGVVFARDQRNDRIILEKETT